MFVVVGSWCFCVVHLHNNTYRLKSCIWSNQEREEFVQTRQTSILKRANPQTPTQQSASVTDVALGSPNVGCRMEPLLARVEKKQAKRTLEHETIKHSETSRTAPTKRTIAHLTGAVQPLQLFNL
jgi:hypothetical protein